MTHAEMEKEKDTFLNYSKAGKPGNKMISTQSRKDLKGMSLSMEKAGSPKQLTKPKFASKDSFGDRASPSLRGETGRVGSPNDSRIDFRRNSGQNPKKQMSSQSPRRKKEDDSYEPASDKVSQLIIDRKNYQRRQSARTIDFKNKINHNYIPSDDDDQQPQVLNVHSPPTRNNIGNIN